MARKTQEIVRDERLVLGDLSIARIASAHEGALTQEFIFKSGTHETAKVSWEPFTPRESLDRTLSVLDYHWEKASAELTEIMRQAEVYRRVKMPAKDDNKPDYLRRVLDDFGGHAMRARPDDEHAKQGIRDHTMFPMVGMSMRLSKMRKETEKDAKAAMRGRAMPEDKFEKALAILSMREKKALDTFDKGTGRDKTDLQDTAGESEFGEDDNWRGNLHKRSSDGYAADIPWRESTKPDIRTPLEKTVDGYITTITNFQDVASRIWMDAAEAVVEHKPVTVDATLLRKLEDDLAFMKRARDTILEEVEYTHAKFELRHLIQMMENPEQSIEGAMQRVISMASRPKELGVIIRDAMPPTRRPGS